MKTPYPQIFFSENLGLFKNIDEEKEYLIFFQQENLERKCKASKIFVLLQWKPFLLFYLGCL